jgi:hypothetical protein
LYFVGQVEQGLEGFVNGFGGGEGFGDFGSEENEV